jgi:hypothetical protein
MPLSRLRKSSEAKLIATGRWRRDRWRRRAVHLCLKPYPADEALDPCRAVAGSHGTAARRRRKPPTMRQITVPR